MGWFLKNKKAEPAKRKRSFAGAAISNLFSDWVASNNSPDSEIYGSHWTLRARARDLERGNTYVEQWLSQLEANIIGDDGIRTTPRPRMVSGKPDKKAAAIISEAWKRFGERENFTANKLFSRPAWSRLVVRTAARDGDGLVEFIRGFPNRDAFAVQLWEGDFLHHEDNDRAQNIRMGIRRDSWGGHLGYRVCDTVENDDLWGSYGIRVNGPVREIRAEMAGKVHVGSSGILAATYQRSGQTRGYSWLASAITQLRQLQMYEEAELVAARIGASKLGFLFDATMQHGDGDYLGRALHNCKPGTFTRLPASEDEVSIQSWDPNNPNGNYPEFRKAMLRGIAAGLKVSYNVLGSDLEGVSFSSIRQGTMSERELWMVAQRWYIETVELPLYRAWLEWALMQQILPFSWLDFERLSHVEMEGRRWDYVNPLQDIQAAKTAIEIGVSSRQKENRKRGQTFDEITDEQATDNATAEGKGLQFQGATASAPEVEEVEQ